MIVRIKEYSPQTGKGKGVAANGMEISFSYKQLKDQKAIPVGKLADISFDNVLYPGEKKTAAKFLWQRVVEYIKRRIK